MAARLVGVEFPNVLSAAAFYLSGKESLRKIDELRESEQGGMAHACELETSIYLAIDPEAVDMSKAVDELGYQQSEYAYMDWSDGPLKLMPWWSSFSTTGVQGRATRGTAAKGEKLLKAAVEEVAGFVTDLKGRPLPVRQTPREKPLQPS
jgi:creatinine amidohydrolase